MSFLRKKRPSRLVTALGYLAALAAVAVAALALVAYLAMPDQRLAGTFTVTAGDSARTVAARLKASGVVRSEGLFLAVVKGEGADRRLQAGTYDLRGAASYAAIGRLLTGDGRSADELTLTVREGWTVRDIAAELQRLKFNHADDFLAAVGAPTDSTYEPPAAWLDKYPFLKLRPAGTSLEGFLFPDTYRVFRDASAASVVEKLLENFARRMDRETMAAVAGSRRDFHAVLTMASLLEEETQTPVDRRLVADLFWRRLARGMRLQADSTVNYVLGTARPAVSAQDLAVESPYNTYRRDGLPLGPICNPGRDAILAAAQPVSNDNWYFLTDASGTVHYAKTYDAHLANKAKYLR